MGIVIHVDFPNGDLRKVIQFYKSVFGWKVKKWGENRDCWIIIPKQNVDYATNNRLVHWADLETNSINTIDVPSVDECMNKIIRNGGKIISPKTTLHGLGYVALCQDTEGNSFNIMQYENG